jgi:hypothetical protein
MTKIYLISISNWANFNPTAFHNYFTSLYPRTISDWWHYIPNIYLVATTLSPSQLYNLIVPGAAGIQYVLIVEVKPGNNYGWLPKDAWDWINKYHNY